MSKLFEEIFIDMEGTKSFRYSHDEKYHILPSSCKYKTGTVLRRIIFSIIVSSTDPTFKHEFEEDRILFIKNEGFEYFLPESDPDYDVYTSVEKDDFMIVIHGKVYGTPVLRNSVAKKLNTYLYKDLSELILRYTY